MLSVRLIALIVAAVAFHPVVPGVVGSPGLQELQSIPVLLEMAGESAGELLGMVEGMDNAF